MKGFHIAIFTIPRPVHINPLLSIVATLVRRGYRVSYVLSEAHASKVRELGVEVLLGPALRVRWDENSKQDDSSAEGMVAHDFLSLADKTLECVAEFYTRSAPDLVLYDTLSFAGRILARKMNIPAILVTTQFEMDGSSLEWQVESLAFRKSILDFNERAGGIFQKHGVRASNVLFHKERLNIYLYIKEYQLPGAIIDAHSYYAGRCPAERPYHCVQKRRADARPTALVSTSTTYSQKPDYYKMCGSALSSLGWRVVLSVGANNSSSHFESPHPSCEISAGEPLPSIMPYADILICLGGPVTTMEALYHGLPLVLLSHGIADGELYAERAAQLGCGIHLRGTMIDAECVKEAVLRVVDDASILSRVRELQSLVRRAPGAEEAVNRIETYLDEMEEGADDC